MTFYLQAFSGSVPAAVGVFPIVTAEGSSASAEQADAVLLFDVGDRLEELIAEFLVVQRVFGAVQRVVQQNAEAEPVPEIGAEGLSEEVVPVATGGGNVEIQGSVNGLRTENDGMLHRSSSLFWPGSKSGPMN